MPGNSETLKRIKGKVMPSENSIFTFMVLMRKILEKSFLVYRRVEKTAKVAKRGTGTHTNIKRRLQSTPFFQRFQLGKEFVYSYYCLDFPSIP